jgi:hypothetical protein
MAKLAKLAKLIRSKNAGPFQLTIDIMFEDEATYLRVKNSGLVSKAFIGAMFRLPEDKVHLVHYDPAYAIKATVPRFTVSGDPDDTDIFGGQQYAELIDLEIPEGNVLA